MNNNTVYKLAFALAASMSIPTGAIRAGGLSTTECDFNGDNLNDLVIGVPGEAIGNIDGSGAVNVIYGAGNGLTSTGNQLWSQQSPGINFDPEVGDAFGSAITCGDYNGDGYDDLAIGVPHESIGSANPVAGAGAVNVIYGSNLGLIATGDQVWHQNRSGIVGVAEGGDLFGWSLASGDFDSDGYSDLAVGIPGESVGSLTNAGAVQILYGTRTGLNSTNNRILDQSTSGIEGSAESGDRLGESLVSGNFNGDNFDDLAIGVPGENITVGEENRSDSGAVNVIYGSSSGLSAAGDQLWHQDIAGVKGSVERYDLFGHSLAAGDFNNDGNDDLAVGVPREGIGAINRAGAVNVLYGSGGGLSGIGDQLWHQNSTGIKGTAEANDVFGFSLTSGDFDGDNRDDLAIGVPGEGVGSVVNAGAINVLFGGNPGLTTKDQLFHQNTQGIKFDAEVGDAFGTTLSSGDFDNDGSTDVVIGIPGEGIGSTSPKVSAGAVSVIYGGSTKLSTRDQVWHQNRDGIKGVAEAYDRLSGELTSSGEYRIGYTNNTLVRVSSGHLRHTPVTRIDMSGKGGGPYTLVAAANGWIRFIVDTNEEPTDDNNYVWIEHPSGEWTKYSHMEKDSVVELGHSVSDWVTAGTAIGIESDVGEAHGKHLHFQVSRPDDPANPINSGGFIIGEDLIPIICGIPGNIFVSGEEYTADDC